jgi:hypothetical protein
MSDRLLNILKDIHLFISHGFNSLPLCIASCTLLIGLFTCNYSMLFFLCGFLVLTPLCSTVINMCAALTGSDNFKISISDVCGVYTDLSRASSTEYGFVSNWLAMMLFFFGYVSTNAISLIMKPPSDETKNEQIVNRKTQTYTAVVLCFIGLCLVLWHRYKSPCEIFQKIGGWGSGLIGFFAIIIYGGFGVGWYYLLSQTGEQRLSDLFGIANRLLIPSAYASGPTACIPNTDPN